MSNALILFLKILNEDIISENDVFKNPIRPFYSNIPDTLRRLISFFYKKTGIFLGYLFLGKWKNNIDKYNIIIIFSSAHTRPIIKFLNKNYPKKRIVVWYWNTLKKDFPLSNYLDLNCEIWTFDRQDADNNKLYFANQFFVPNKNLSKSKVVESIDVFFVGVDKNRYKKLIEMKKIFQSKNIVSKFLVVDDGSNKQNTKLAFSQPISYDDVLSLCRKSRCLLEILQEGQNGLTLRAIESLVLNKKLITNNINIIYEDFYNKNNIFVIGIDRIEEIDQFLISKNVHIDDDIVKKYTFDGWVETIQKGETL